MTPSVPSLFYRTAQGFSSLWTSAARCCHMTHSISPTGLSCNFFFCSEKKKKRRDYVTATKAPCVSISHVLFLYRFLNCWWKRSSAAGGSSSRSARRCADPAEFVRAFTSLTSYLAVYWTGCVSLPLSDLSVSSPAEQRCIIH